MKTARQSELPPERQHVLRRAILLEWASIAYLVSVAVLTYLVMSTSQVMKTELIENALNLVPPVVFLLSVHVRDWEPNRQYPYGYHRAVTIAFLAAALALLAVGGYLLTDAVITLVKAERPTIGTVELFGRPVWLGWLMLPVLFWAVVPAVFLGRAKVAPARQLHDKTLYADAVMNKAEWMTSLAAMAGVAGLTLGWWWADAAAAAVISLDVVYDGVKHVRAVTGDLMDRTPRAVDDRAVEALPARLVTELKRLKWVRDAQVRLRDNGHVFYGEAFITPVDQRRLVARTEEALEVAYGLDWRLQELVVQMTHPDGEPSEAEPDEVGDSDEEAEKHVAEAWRRGRRTHTGGL